MITILAWPWVVEGDRRNKDHRTSWIAYCVISRAQDKLENWDILWWLSFIIATHLTEVIKSMHVDWGAGSTDNYRQGEEIIRP